MHERSHGEACGASILGSCCSEWALGQAVPVEPDCAPCAACHGAGQPLSQPGTWCHQRLGGFGLFLYWKIKAEPSLSVRGGSATSPQSHPCAVLPCPCPTLSCPQQVAEQSHQPWASHRAADRVCAVSAVPKLQRKTGTPGHPLFPPSAPLGATPCPEQPLGSQAKRGWWVGAPGWDPQTAPTGQNQS